MSSATPLVDRFGRRVSTLRISLTDQCNFRCVYCMPPEGLEYAPKSGFLTLDAVERVVRVSGAMGVTRFRLTGGEPLLRPDIVEIVERLSAVPVVRELSMTTNGSLLARHARSLRSAGLDRLNISLDSLDEARFAEVTRSRRFDRVRDGVEAAIAAGFPVKINVVVMAGMDDAEILEFAALAAERSLDVRFLEFMPLCGSAWESDRVLPMGHVRDVVRGRYDLDELPRGDRPAQSFAIRGTRGRVGFIAPLSEPFCEDCSRIRITASGRIRPCLFSETEFDIAPFTAPGVPDAELSRAIRDAVWNKPAGSQFRDEPFEAGASRRSANTGAMIRSVGG